MTLTRQDLEREAAATGFAAERGDLVAWVKDLVDECRERLTVVLPLRNEEHEFLTLLNDRGQIAPDLLTGDETMKVTIREHPALLWKALNVARRGPPTDQEKDLV